MKKYFLLFLLGLNFSLIQAQIGGNSVYKFLNLAGSAKQTALGGKVFTSLNGDIFQPAQNPAVLDSTMNNKLGANYSSYLSSLNYGNLAYARKIKKIGVVYAGVSYINYGTFQYADESGERNGTFGASESALLLGYAYRIPKTNFKLGVNTKFIFSSLETYTSTGIALDFGFYYHNEKEGIETGLSLRNFGMQLSTYQGTKESLPFDINLTFSKMFLHAPFRWYVTFENLQKPKIAFVNTAHNTEDPNGDVVEENISFTDHFFRHLIIGAELFPRKRFNLRLGYNFRRFAELSLQKQQFISGINFGFSLRLRKFEIAYGYGKYNLASNAHFFTATINLNEF